MISKATNLWSTIVSFVKQKKRDRLDERRTEGIRKQETSKETSRNKASSTQTINLFISEIGARRMVGSLLNVLIEKDVGRKRSWRNEVTSSYLLNGNEEKYEKCVRVPSDPDSHLAREEYDGCPECIQPF